ncbi:MAG: 6,7-dimethyl-8-ribityllumazine synthase [Planctomycetaceae bacterium]|nr:6,7-dimethyl-8-ribityllumazine synthase [Planctomycetaceae bacterium]
MPQVLEGALEGRDHRFAVVVSRYNESITTRLLEGAIETLVEAGVADASVHVAWVPGAWEIPLVADKLARTQDYAGVICLGAVIRGETQHDQYINRQVSDSLGQIALSTGVPTGFGLLTCESLEQAIQRAGGAVGNKGVECAQAVLRMADLLRRLPSLNR